MQYDSWQCTSSCGITFCINCTNIPSLVVLLRATTSFDLVQVIAKASSASVFFLLLIAFEKLSVSKEMQYIYI